MLLRENGTVVLIFCTKLKCVCVNIIIVVESHHVNYNVRRAQCDDMHHRLPMCNILFKVVNNIQCYFH